VGGLGPSEELNFGLKVGDQARGTYGAEDRDAEGIKRDEE